MSADPESVTYDGFGAPIVEFNDAVYEGWPDPDEAA